MSAHGAQPAPIQVEVPPLLAGVRADRAVAMLTGLPRSAVRALLDGGAVTLDGSVLRRGATQLAAGQRLVVALEAPSVARVTPEPEVPVDVVVEDPDFVVVDKRAGQVVHPGAGHVTGTLVAGLLARYPELAELGAAEGADPLRPGIVHRLDKGTSGLLVVARTDRAVASLVSQLAAHAAQRRYLGLVEGDVADDRGTVDAPLGRSLRSPTKMAVRPGGRPAVTEYEVRARFPAARRTYVELRLRTGRTHQIRVHLAAIGRPIVNDPQYGRRREPRLDEGRLFLHAHALAFAHPATGEPVEASSPLPGDLQALLDAVSRDDAGR